MSETLTLIMRWLHVSSMATLVGGFLYARFAAAPGMGVLAPDSRAAVSEKATAAYRPFVCAAIAGSLLSGLYTVFSNPGHSPRYHMLLGIKLLLALHVFASAILIGRAGNPRRGRMMASAVISGLIIVAISAYLRRIF